MSSNINELKLYFGDDYPINDYITLHQPKVNDVIEMGEADYYSTVYALTAIPSDMKSQLWDAGYCWEDIPDFNLFAMLSVNLDVSKTSVFFGDLDFTKFQLGKRTDTDELVLFQITEYGEEIVLDNYAYLKIVQILRKIHNLKPKIERAATKTVRMILIEEDRKKHLTKKDEDKGSMLLPLISSLINCSEFKYGLNEVRDMPLMAFMDSVSRVQIIKSTTALLHGCYSGMIDTSKINKKELNWMRNIEES